MSGDLLAEGTEPATNSSNTHAAVPRRKELFHRREDDAGGVNALDIRQRNLRSQALRADCACAVVIAIPATKATAAIALQKDLLMGDLLIAKSRSNSKFRDRLAATYQEDAAAMSIRSRSSDGGSGLVAAMSEVVLLDAVEGLVVHPWKLLPSRCLITSAKVGPPGRQPIRIRRSRIASAAEISLSGVSPPLMTTG